MLKCVYSWMFCAYMCILIAIMLKCLDGRGAIEILTVSFPVNIIEEILPFTDYQLHKVFTFHRLSIT